VAVTTPVNRHPDVERHVRLAATRATGDLAGLRGEVDRGLRTRRFLGYRESSEWARAAQPLVDELRRAVERARRRGMSSGDVVDEGRYRCCDEPTV